jgi:Tol biopolymer transport system component
MTHLRRFVLLLTAAASLAVFFAPAASSWSGANGEIVFETFIDGGGEDPTRGRGIGIAPLGADRSQIRHLTVDPADSQPQASPDGRQVVFVRSSDPASFRDETPTTIYVIDVDGSGLRAVTDGLHADEEPAFSPSGTRIYFTRLDPINGGDIFSVNLDGSGLRRITNGSGNDHHPRAASRGGILTFERQVSGPHSVRYHHVFAARADGSRLRDLTPKLGNRIAATDPEFSPDGSRIVYSAGDRLLSVRVNGTKPRVLLPPRTTSDNIYADPTYAPDGRSLLFSTVDSSTGRSSMRRLDLRHLRRLPNPLVEPHISVRSPAWLVQPRG